MSSKIEVQKICELCGGEFTARKTTTRYCSHRCASQAYKAEKRKEKVQFVAIKQPKPPKTQVMDVIQSKEYISISEAAALLSTCRQTIYNYLQAGKFKSAQLSGRKTLIRRQDIDELFFARQAYEAASNAIKAAESARLITEFYTIPEITARYRLKYGRIHQIITRNNIPTTKRGSKLLVSKVDVDKYFNTQALAEPEEVMEWYTVAEAMEKYNLTRDMVYHHCKTRSIPKQQDGKFIKISKAHFDNIFNPIIPKQ
mgnify:CR=1 FL=1